MNNQTTTHRNHQVTVTIGNKTVKGRIVKFLKPNKRYRSTLLDPFGLGHLPSTSKSHRLIIRDIYKKYVCIDMCPTIVANSNILRA